MKAQLTNNVLTLEIPLDTAPPLSKSGKSRLAFSSRTFIKTGVLHPTYGEISVSMNVIVPVAPSATSPASPTTLA